MVARGGKNLTQRHLDLRLGVRCTARWHLPTMNWGPNGSTNTKTNKRPQGAAVNQEPKHKRTKKKRSKGIGHGRTSRQGTRPRKRGRPQGLKGPRPPGPIIGRWFQPTSVLHLRPLAPQLAPAQKRFSLLRASEASELELELRQVRARRSSI